MVSGTAGAALILLSAKFSLVPVISPNAETWSLKEGVVGCILTVERLFSTVAVALGSSGGAK